MAHPTNGEHPMFSPPEPSRHMMLHDRLRRLTERWRERADWLDGRSDPAAEAYRRAAAELDALLQGEPLSVRGAVDAALAVVAEVPSAPPGGLPPG